MAYCSSTNKLEAEELAEEGEEESLEVDESGHITAEVRVIKECAGCGSEAKEYTFTLEGDVEVPEEHQGDGHGLEARCDSWTTTDGVQKTVARGKSKGKRITRHRYMKRLLGVEGEVVVECECGEEVGRVTLSDEVQASAFEGGSH